MGSTGRSTGGSYEYNGSTIVIGGTNGEGAVVYGPNNSRRAFANEAEAEEFVRSTPEERNARELYRVTRENERSGFNNRSQLQTGQSYTMDWSRNETRTGTYIGTTLVNGEVVNQFRQSNGRILMLDDSDIRRLNVRRSR